MHFSMNAASQQISRPLTDGDIKVYEKSENSNTMNDYFCTIGRS